MKTIFTSLAVVFSALSARAQISVSVSFDNTYDNATNSLAIVACSNGPNGLLTKGFTTFGSLPAFPNIGGAQVVTGFNSPNCGTCWNLELEGNSINVLAIDVASNGFNIGEAAFDTLTNGQGPFLGRITAIATQVNNASVCGLQ